MNRQGVMGAILTVGGLLVTAASIPHAFLGWPALRDSLQGVASHDAILTAAIGWLFGSFAMAMLGVVALISASQMRHGHSAAKWQAVVVGAGYIIFGFWALWYSGGSPHFIGFLVMGGAVAVGAGFYSSRGKAHD